MMPEDEKTKNQKLKEGQPQYFDEFMSMVDRGRSGKNHWIPYPFKNMEDRLGMTQSMYHLIGGEPGSGKSAFTDLVYVLQAYLWWKQIGEERGMDLEIYLRSMERSREYRVAKWVCWTLFQRYNLLYSPKQLLNWAPGESIVDQTLYEEIQKVRDFFDKMQDEVLTIIDGPENPTGIYKHHKEIAKANGTIDSSGPEKTYEPDDDQKLIIYILDHIGALRSETDARTGRLRTGKDLLDKMSEYLQIARDQYGMMTVVINQFNRNLNDSIRRTGTLEPEKGDFKGSGNMYEDCDAAVALFNPHEYHMDENLGYEVSKFVTEEGYNRYRSAYILKNTYGADNCGFGLNFIGECGHYRKLPPPDEMDRKKYRLFRTLEDEAENLESSNPSGGGISLSAKDAENVNTSPS